MSPTINMKLKLVSGLLLSSAAHFDLASAALSQSIADRILIKDVVIVGGGASGSHAALRLKEDYGKNVVLIEKENHLGGHVSYYRDPITNRNVDYGLNSFDDYGPTRAFFSRLNVSVTPAVHAILPSIPADFSTGQSLAGGPEPDMGAVFAALGQLYGLVKPYESILYPSYSAFPTTSAAVPADLLLTFGEFVTKYNLQAAVNQIFQITGSGVGNLLNTLTLYVLQAFGVPTLEGFLGISNGGFVPTSGRNIEIYEKIATRLGTSNILYSSTVVQSLRTDFGVVLWVKGADNKYTLVLADKLIIAIEPTTSNIEPFNPTSDEDAVFSKLQYSTVFAGLVSHPSLPANASVVNVAVTQPLGIPVPNFTLRFDSVGDGLFSVGVVGNQALTSDAAKGLVTMNLNSLISSGALPNSSAPVTFKAWANHGPMHARLSAPDVRAGLITKQNSLQGKKSTWYTGAAWSSTSTAVLWAFNDQLLPRLVAA